ARSKVKGTSAAIVVKATSPSTLTAGITGPATGVRGQPLTYTLTASEVGILAGTVYKYRIDWDGNGSVDQIVSGPSGLMVSHAFPVARTGTIRVKAVDGAGNVSPQAAALPVTIKTVDLQTDPGDNTKMALVVGGTI